MDIEYLLYLQQFRETVGSILTPLMNAVTKLSAGFLPIAMMCMIYWAFDRKAGRKILAGLGGGLFINGFLKLTFCVYRPWIRDTRILPYGDSKTAATGYSFPSGHTTRATAMFGGSAIKILKYNGGFNTSEVALLAIGMIVAFVLSIVAIKFLMSYIKKHDFKVFGWYRIVLGVVVIGYFLASR